MQSKGQWAKSGDSYGKGTTIIPSCIVKSTHIFGVTASHIRFTTTPILESVMENIRQLATLASFALTFIKTFEWYQYNHIKGIEGYLRVNLSSPLLSRLVFSRSSRIHVFGRLEVGTLPFIQNFLLRSQPSLQLGQFFFGCTLPLISRAQSL